MIRKRAYLFLFILCARMGYSADAPHLLVFYAKFPSFEFKGKEGQPSDFSMEVLQTIAKNAGISFTIEFSPWKRVLIELEKNQHSMLFTTMRNESREDHDKWVGPITGRLICIL